MNSNQEYHDVDVADTSIQHHIECLYLSTGSTGALKPELMALRTVRTCQIEYHPAVRPINARKDAMDTKGGDSARRPLILPSHFQFLLLAPKLEMHKRSV